VSDKYWRSNKCEAMQVMLPTDSDFADYQPGDTEPCLCGDLQCYATVRRGTPPAADTKLAAPPVRPA
jgi:hypothetical protein